MSDLLAGADAGARTPSVEGIHTLADLCRRAGVEELEADNGQWFVRLRLDNTVPAATALPQSLAEHGEPDGPYIQLSQWVGIFHRTAESGGEVLAREHQRVREGQVVAVISAMQLQHEIRAEREGALARFLVEDDSPVEYGQPLLELA